MQDAHEAAVREQLLGKTEDDDDDDPLLNPTSVHGWVPYKPASGKPQGSRFCRNTCALAWKNFTKLRSRHHHHRRQFDHPCIHAVPC